ncbi:TPA: HNH endonuclease [Bacillus thuringiensis]|uniref:Cytoplasmic protein n=1 Tax=Bacillus thuringiensis serovar iberica TaxID=180866 RepID=A0A9X6LDI9_BACTU|nr:HNH endonuclease [Bacillus thuringiensis]MEB9622858.1 HNH endonuclease [Bacillus cereus]OUB40407.1 cytoplasmic protein [Bacillus thuringiensis serovar iberica]HDR5349735.1 HNH endonuclease [Bacillus thuringiensis]HDX9634856.1 HNH endonuclease [Bacillus cereus]
MSLNMYLGEVQAQAQSMNAFCTTTIQGMEQAIQSIDAFTSDTVLQGQTYDSAKAFFAETFRPLAQGIIYLCEELIRQNDAFPSQFQSQVASTDVIEQEILEQIREIDRMIASTEALHQTMPNPGMNDMVNLFAVMKRKLQEKLEHLYEFNQTSSDNYSTAIQLAANIATGLAEVQSGKGFSPASGTFSTQGLNMEWVTSIQSITEDKNRQADNSIEEGAMCGKIPPQSEQSFWDRNKKDLSDAWTGISTGVVDGVVDAWDGFVALGDKETWLNMKDAIVNYKETLPAAWNALSDSFMNELWNGDMESREHYAAYVVTSLLTGFIGSKGLDKVGQAGKVATVTSLTKGKSLLTHSSVYTNALYILNNYELKAGNHLSYAGIGSTQQYLQKAATYTYEGPNGPKTIRLRKGELAGDKHPVSGVPYDAKGFPIFDAVTEITLKEVDLKKDRTAQFRICNKALYEQILKDPKLASKFTEKEIEMFKSGKKPKTYTWHHHQDTGRMQLVDAKLHKQTGHTGGYKIWGKDSDK